ncbi:MAG TPA: phage tail protein [Xanthobacteraceae bacterium]|nr:phage tail protein [Xanthobacteraceae bacterium]
MPDILGPSSTNAVTSRPSGEPRGDLDTWFKDCTSPTAKDGTVIPAQFLNDVLAQLRVAFDYSGILRNNADDMLWRAMQSVGLRYGQDTGSVNAAVVTFSPAVTALGAGLAVLVRVAYANTGPMTLTANAMAPKNWSLPDGSPIPSGALAPGMITMSVYDGAKFQLLSRSLGSTGGGASRYAPGELVIATGNAPLAGTLKANGQVINRADYPALWEYAAASGRIVTDSVWLDAGQNSWAAYSSGNGTSTFRLPDLRGEFMRMFADGRSGVDAGRALGAAQADMVKQHTHGVDLGGSYVTAGAGADYGKIGNGDVNAGAGNFSGATITPFGGAETRPRNFAGLACIAY